jgi:hypothetical protein
MNSRVHLASAHRRKPVARWICEQCKAVACELCEDRLDAAGTSDDAGNAHSFTAHRPDLITARCSTPPPRIRAPHHNSTLGDQKQHAGITLARAAPASAIGATKATNASAVHATPRTASERTTSGDGAAVGRFEHGRGRQQQRRDGKRGGDHAKRIDLGQPPGDDQRPDARS